MIGSLGVVVNDTCSKGDDTVFLPGWAIPLIVLGLPLLAVIFSWLMSQRHRRTRSNR